VACFVCVGVQPKGSLRACLRVIRQRPSEARHPTDVGRYSRFASALHSYRYDSNAGPCLSRQECSPLRDNPKVTR